MNDARADEPSSRGVTRWWRNPALARAAFGAPTFLEHDATGATEPDLADPAQREFGEYELLELIGRGGMGLVYRARQRGLAREVAIKLLSGGPWASPEFVARFEQEARHAAQLQHPGIVAIHELGESVDGVYYAMQLVRGESLAQRLHAGGHWTPREAATLLRQIAEAVAYAHSLGVLHLDLKPGNVLIDEHGHPLIADFGLARRIEAGTDDAFIAGTPGYMAPEQAIAGHPLNEATDVWGLGAILHELLCGRPPGDSEDDALVAIPADLRAICRKCIAKAPEQRYASARTLADDLGRFLENRGVRARPLTVPQRIVRWARREPRLATAACMALLALVAGIVATSLQWWRAEANATAAREQTWATRGDAAWRLVRDGRPFDAVPPLLANLHEREAHGDIAGTELERLRLGTLRWYNPQWIDTITVGGPGLAVAVDGKGSRVAVSIGEGLLRLYDARDGRELWRIDAHDASDFWPWATLERINFSRDDRYLIAERNAPRTVTRPSGHDNILIDVAAGRIVLPPAQRFADFRDATYSGDGKFAILRDHRNQAQLFRVDGWQALSPPQPTDAINGMWRIGDGGRFVARSVPGSVELLDPHSLVVRHAIPAGTKDGLFSAWAVQPGGDLLALGAVDGSVRLLDTKTLSLRELKPSPYATVEWLSFSADGRWLTATADTRGFVWDIASGSGGALPAGRHVATRIEADAESGMVLVAHPPEATLWRLPDSDAKADLRQRIDAAEPLAAQLPIGSAAEDHAVAWAPAVQLAASIDVDGRLRLWRWRRTSILQARAAPQIASELHFDGSHVATANGNAVRVLTVNDERAASPKLLHPQPVSLASLLPDDRGLLTVSGRELRVFDWREGRLRFPPIVLGNSPLRVAIGPDAGTLLVCIGAYRNGRFHELLSSYDLHDGRPLAADVAVPGPLAGLRFSPDGRFVVHWRYGELGVRETMSLRPYGKALRLGPDVAAALRRQFADGWYPDIAAAELTGTRIVDAALDAKAVRLTVITRASESADARLLQFDPLSGRELSVRDFGKHQPLQLLARGDAYTSVVWTLSEPRWFDSDGDERPLPQMPAELLGAQAISRDGRWLASVSRKGAVVAERDSRQWATAPLPAPLPAGDPVTQLAFAPDAGGLLARSYHGRWLWWPLPREPRSIAGLQARVEQLQSAAEATVARGALRADDPGPSRNRSAAATMDALPSGVAPPGYAFVDLAPAINRPLDAANVVFGDKIGTLAMVPGGTQRFLGIDYEIHGMVALGMPARHSSKPTISAPASVPVPRFGAVHLLAGACCMLQNMAGLLHVPYGYFRIAYADGGHARVPIVYGRDIMEAWTDAGDSLPARIAWIEAGPRPDIIQRARLRLYALRLENPHPQREVSGIAFEASDAAWSGPIILAATLETSDMATAGSTTAH